MNNKVYLIHEEDYIKHIDEKVMLYSFVKQLAHCIGRMKTTGVDDDFIKMAECYDATAENLFNSWGIPKSYVTLDNKDNLAPLMENELIAPEEAGYYPCDDDYSCNCCCKDEDDESDENDDLVKMIEALSSVIHSIIKENATVHIVIE
jgi:hypothetical protein